MEQIAIGVVGIGKIARDQHLPALAQSSDFDLVATASRTGRVDAVPGYNSVEELLTSRPDVAAISLCTISRLEARYFKVCCISAILSFFLIFFT